MFNSHGNEILINSHENEILTKVNFFTFPGGLVIAGFDFSGIDCIKHH